MTAPFDYTPCGHEREVVEVDAPDREPIPEHTGSEGTPPRPNDEDVRRLMADCRKARAIFTSVLGLGAWELRWVYHREPFTKPNRGAAMYVVTDDWPYMRAQVHVSIDACYDDDYERTRYKVVHELSHLLVEPLLAHTKGLKSQHVVNATERLVHQIAAAVLDAYDREPESDEEEDTPRCPPGSGVWRVKCRDCGAEHVQVAPLDVRWPTECQVCHEMRCEKITDV